MTVTFSVPTVRVLAIGFALVLLGVVLGPTLIKPVSAATQTRVASCAGLSFYPSDSRTEYRNAGTKRVLMEGDNPAGANVFRCDPGLPNAAVVKKVRFTVRLNDELYGFPGGVTNCALRRSGLTASTAETVDDLARPTMPTSGPTGVYRVTDSSITNATINNANYGYWLECQLLDSAQWGTGADPGLYGADVTYTISAANG